MLRPVTPDAIDPVVRDLCRTLLPRIDEFAERMATRIRNAIMLVHCYQVSDRADGESDHEFVMRVTRDRVGPVLLTALAVAAMAVPALFLGPVAGLELLYPWAVVVLGGLVSATLLTLFVLPALYQRVASASRALEWED